MITSQFQPYRTGWEIRPVRLAPNTTALTTAATAIIDPSRVDRTGTDRTPAPGSSALRVPTTADGGSPAATAAWAMTDGWPWAWLARGRADRAASTASSPSSTTINSAAPVPAIAQSAWNPRSGS